MSSNSIKKAHANRRSGRLPTLKRRSEFLRTLRRGFRVPATEWLVLHVAPASEFRCGWTLPRAVGSAVVRNRLKRWLREWLRSRIQNFVDSESTPLAEINFRFQERPRSSQRRDLGDLKRDEFDRQLERAWGELNRRLKRQLDRPQPVSFIQLPGRSKDSKDS